MINWEEFNEIYLQYGSDIVLTIIEELEIQYKEIPPILKKSILEKDFAGIKFYAHKIKGSVANFYDPEPVNYAGILEKMGNDEIGEGLLDVYDKFIVATDNLMIQLLKYREEQS